GLNDTWVIDNAELYNDLKVTILNRWGKVVYTNSNYKNDWSAQGLEAGTYYYSVQVRGQERTGYIQVIR
nr:gliding motility-associated C-terminal domain-containing protein [Pyrinomonadaceae bacterium]